MCALPVFMLLMSGVMKIMQTEDVVKGFATWPHGVTVPIGILEITCTLIYLIPRTAVLGAILLTGYGGRGGVPVPSADGAACVWRLGAGLVVAR